LVVQDLSLQICQLTSPEKEKKNGEIAKLRQLQNFFNTKQTQSFFQDQRFFFQFCDVKNLAKFSKKLTKSVKFTLEFIFFTIPSKHMKRVQYSRVYYVPSKIFCVGCIGQVTLVSGDALILYPKT
jgi:hypothetical protein